jgi:hypothetical protein
MNDFYLKRIGNIKDDGGGPDPTGPQTPSNGPAETANFLNCWIYLDETLNQQVKGEKYMHIIFRGRILGVRNVTNGRAAPGPNYTVSPLMGK